MISNIWNWIKNIFKPEKQDPHLVLYEEVKKLYVNQNTVQHINRFKKSCPDCREIIK